MFARKLLYIKALICDIRIIQDFYLHNFWAPATETALSRNREVICKKMP